ncbi:hypothetical protein GLOTRDRAFT_68985 [Gloeophyllum trabeum ATCC 11539]|uniref:Uncharacterized protein n=1 Tax=Gloeophyllum trabeum (strain ATCC 11539 / FP-39264 / Madison 617) TaxID=670483 RepID=S7QN01_GLOTA|nr:uncharacterized protein GLOTRDRAFT_68985 [Gloeophyllum trabeum ATCC 11539]EPQ60936.1 hypothetical protein GLOTRDRAFT_68985 [Gloeophyllum trabeum ATCC 11539]
MTSIALARAYQQSFDTHPYGTLAVTNGALNAFGDFVAQIAQKTLGPNKTWEDRQRQQYDVLRTLRFFAFGFTMGPVIGRWNIFLERRFPLRTVQTGSSAGKVSARALTKRVAADQLFMAPIGLVAFLGSMGVMEGRDAAHIKGKFRDLYVPAITANWQVWPIAQLINFRYMPLPYRVPFQSTCGVFWTLYLSILNAKEDQMQDQQDALQKTRG